MFSFLNIRRAPCFRSYYAKKFAILVFIFSINISHLSAQGLDLSFLENERPSKRSIAVSIKEELVWLQPETHSQKEQDAPINKGLIDNTKEYKALCIPNKYLFVDTKNSDGATLYSFPKYRADYTDSARFVNVFPVVDSSGLFDFASMHNIVALSINPRSTLEFFLKRAENNNCKLDFSESEINFSCGNYAYKIYFSGNKIAKIDVIKKDRLQLLAQTTFNYGNSGLPTLAHVEYFHNEKAAIRKTLSFCVVSHDFKNSDINLFNVGAIGAIKILDARLNPPKSYYFKNAIPDPDEAEIALKDNGKQKALNAERASELHSAKKSDFILNIQKLFKETFKRK